ncbi:MAG: ABC transporter ATP-binding protein [Phycisphaerales bacterium JB040]
MPENRPNALEIEDLEFVYPGGRGGARVRSLAVRAGERVLLVGGSGSGKSTLLHLIAGLIDPQRGTVRIGGEDIHALHGARRDLFRGRHVGIVFQSFHLLRGFSAIENVMAGMMFGTRPRGEHRALAARLLDELGIAEHDADAGELSIGQQQRVAVARALACEPALVLADEPTASLDPANGAAAVELLQRVCAQHGAALVCVSHDPALEARFERVERLEELAGASPAQTGGGR